MEYPKNTNPVYVLEQNLAQQREDIFKDRNLSDDAKERLLKMMLK